MVDFDSERYRSFKYCETWTNNSNHRTCHGHQHRTRGCGEICLDCGDGYCGCLSTHCCCSTPVIGIEIIPVNGNGNFIPSENIESKKRELIKQMFDQQDCKESRGLCWHCAYTVHKGLNGPGFDPDGIRVVPPLSRMYEYSSQARQDITDNMMEWLTSHPRVIYKEVIGDEEIIHRQRVEDYRTEIMKVEDDKSKLVNSSRPHDNKNIDRSKNSHESKEIKNSAIIPLLPFDVAGLIAEYCSNVYRVQPTKNPPDVTDESVEESKDVNSQS